MKLGLEQMRKLDALFGFPSQKFQSIHVAGTNGKGSVTTKIATSLQVKGKKIGLYTSPHISTFRERIRINGEMIPQEVADEILQEMRGKGIKCTFFEAMTLMAFLYFAQEEVDIAVLEVGMGGRLDATNIVTPLLSIITSIQLDHTCHLGKTLEAIAFEKAGIIKPGIPVLTGPKARTFPIFEIRAKEEKSSYFSLQADFGNYEEENREIAKKALQLLPFEYDVRGLESIPPCRFERFEKEIPIILDVAHNPGGFEALFQRLKGKKIHVLMGLGGDKEVKETLQVVAQHATFIHLTQSDNPRAACAQDLGKSLLQLGYKDFEVDPDPLSAFRKARVHALKKGAHLCVCGTFYIMSAIRKELGILEPSDALALTPY